MSSTSILISDDHKILRQGLAVLLNKQENFHVIAEVNQEEETIEACKKFQPDIIILDTTSSHSDPVETIEKIRQISPESKIIALSMQQKRSYISKILKHGALGYILKEKAFSELISAIDAVKQNKIYLCPTSSNIILEDYLSFKRYIQSQELLNDKERNLISLIADGMTSKQIAEKLGISDKTVDSQRRKIMKKLKLNNLVDLVKYAICEGLTSLD